jgi:hypothetical protein
MLEAPQSASAREVVEANKRLQTLAAASIVLELEHDVFRLKHFLHLQCKLGTLPGRFNGCI